MKNKSILILAVFLMMVSPLVAKPVTVKIDDSIHILEAKVIEGKTYVKLRNIAELLGYEVTLRENQIDIKKEGNIHTLGACTSMYGEYYYSMCGELRNLNTKIIDNTNYVSIRDFTEYFFLSMIVDQNIIHINTKPLEYKRFTDTSKIINNKSITNLGEVEVVIDDIEHYMIENDKIYYINKKGAFKEPGSAYLMRCDLDGTNKEVLVKQHIYTYATNQNTDYIIYTYKHMDPNNPRANGAYIPSQIEVYNKKTKEITHIAQAPVMGTVFTGVGVLPNGRLYFEQGEYDLGYYRRYWVTENLDYVPDEGAVPFNRTKTDVIQDSNKRYFIDENEGNVGIYSSDINGENKKLLHKIYTDVKKQASTPQEGAACVHNIEFTFDNEYIYCQLARVFKNEGYWNDRKNAIYRISKNSSTIEWILMDSSASGTYFKRKNYFEKLSVKDNYLYFIIPIVTIRYDNERFEDDSLYRIRVAK